MNLALVVKVQNCVYFSASEGPTAFIEEDVVTRKVGENLTVICQTTGEPAPTITWMKEQQDTGEKKAIPLELYDNPQRALSFKELKQVDRGNYFCVARNIFDEVEAEVTVIICKLSTVKGVCTCTFS